LVLSRPDPGDSGTDVDTTERPARRFEEAVHVLFQGQVRVEDRRVAELCGEGLGAISASVVVDGNACSFGGEGTCAGSADSARCARDHDALARQSGVHLLKGYAAR
jgi:hypothetical protein